MTYTKPDRNLSPCAGRRFLVLAALMVAGQVAGGAITVEGVTDKTVYADRVTLRVPAQSGYDYTVALDGAPIPTGVEIEVDAVDYHELRVSRQRSSGGATESLLVRFIVRSSARGSTEVGLPPWTPYPQIPSAAAEFAGATLTMVAPAQFPQGLEIPMVALVEDATGKRVGVNGYVRAPEFPGNPVRLLRGVGSSYLPAARGAGPLAFTARIQTLTTPKEIQIDSSTTWTTVAQDVNATTTWSEDARIHVTTNFTVAGGATLTIGAGSVVKLAAGVAITVDGTLAINGTRDRPVVFCPETRTAPWGGFRFSTATSQADLRGAIFTGSGANPNWFDEVSGAGSTHRKEESLIYLKNGARATLTDCYLLDGHGQGGHGDSSYLTMTRCLVQRFTTTGQYNWGSVTLNECALVEFPSADASFANGDNDAIYLTGGSHSLTDCLIGWTLDDGVDAGGGSGPVDFIRCWFESTYHEGMALSAQNQRRAIDTVAINCGQGIECGFTNPGVPFRVDADRCLSTANVVGARFGDSYDWTYDGFLTVTNSLLLYNHRDVWGRAWETWEEHLSQMDIHGNFLSAADPSYPSNTVWQPVADASRLVPFLPSPEGDVGVGFATRTQAIDRAQIDAGIPVRLSTFTTRTVSVDYTARASGAIVASDTLEFLPGETVKKIAVGEALGFIDVVLSNPVNAEITGFSRVSFVQNATLVPAGSRWRYSDTGSDLGTAWRERTFNHGSWKEGQAELGFGDGDEVTTVSGGPSDNRYPTIYFRKLFDVADPAAYEGLIINLRRDDGAVVHINGEEVFRSSMPEGTVAYGTWADSTATDSEETAFFSDETAADMLVAGSNAIAVEVHQAAPTSSDLSFDCELIAKPAAPTAPAFKRGDANGDGMIDISDPVNVLRHAFAGRATDCEDALDANDDGDLNVADAIYLLSYLFGGGLAIPPPFDAAGEDTTTDGLGCSRR